MAIDAQISGINKDLSKSLAAGANEDFRLNFNESFWEGRKADYYVYIYNISENTYTVSRPPYLPLITIKGKAKHEQYSCSVTIPHPFMEFRQNLDANEVERMPMNGKRVAMDIVNPDNLSFDQDRPIDGKSDSSSGTNNLSKRGVFWSLNNPPKPEELAKATVRLEAYYTGLLEKADAVQISDPALLKDLLTADYHYAAEYFGEDKTWHAKKVKPTECERCGEKVKNPSAAFHKLEEGGYCIRDWSKAVLVGIKTRAQAFEATRDKQFAPDPAASVPAPVSSTPAAK
jgi:hypothetical protein